MDHKRFMLIILCSIGLLLARSLEHVPDFGKNPGHLRLYHYIPQTADTTRALPLLLVLHGSGQTAYSLSRASGFNKLADSLGFIILYPDQPFYNNLLTAFQFYMPGKMKKGQGETASIRHMIDYMEDHYKIDHDRIFITGMSAGAAMANVMLNAYPDLFAAGALLAAPSLLHEGINPDHSHYPRIAVIHGKNDLTVPPKHSDRIVKQWREYLEIENTEPRVTKNYLGHPLLTLTDYSDNDNIILVRLDIAKTGHLLLVDPGDSLKQGGHYSLFTKDIDFHLPYWIISFFHLTLA